MAPRRPEAIDTAIRITGTGGTVASGPVTVRCPSCSRSWEVQPKPDGARPKTARCAAYRGGCGRVVKVPQQAATGSPAVKGTGPAPAVWDPPSQARRERLVAEQCPQCGAGEIWASPRGTIRVCASCGPVTPRGVAAPYERGTGSTREARSQRERDDDAKKTVIVAGEFLRRVEALAADPRIHPASGDLLGWYAEEIADARKARSGRRLAELAVEFGADLKDGAIRRRYWWQGQPAAITAEPDDAADDAQDDDYDEDDECPGDAPAALTASAPAVPAVVAGPQRMTWAEALAALGWRIMPVAEWAGCQIVSQGGNRCGSPEEQAPYRVGPPDQRGGWACGTHHFQLTQMIAQTNQARGIT